MTAKIKYGRWRLVFWAPTRLAGKICFACAKRKIEERGINIEKSRRLKREINHAVREAKKIFGRFVLVEVKAKDGTSVIITV